MTEQKQFETATKIKDDYIQKQPDKLDELKALNDKVKTPPTVLAWVLGVLGALVLGVGMCICLGVLVKNLMAVGVVVGCVGIAVMIANVFIYKAFLKSRKAKYSAQILQIADQICAPEE